MGKRVEMFVIATIFRVRAQRPGRSCARSRARTFRSYLRLGWLLLVLSPHAVHADEIILKNGKIIQGTARITGDRVVIQPWNSPASIVLDRDRIEAIIQKDVPPLALEAGRTDTLKSEDPPASQIQPKGEARSDAANARLAEPRFPQAPDLPDFSYDYEPAPDPQVKAAVESVFPRIVSICIAELGMTLEPELPLRIRIFEDLQSFESQRIQNSTIHYAVEAYYAVEDDTIVVWGNENGQKMVASIYHEATHALLRREFEMVPSWIDEGLAEFFEGFRVQGSATVALAPQYNNGWARRFLLENRLLPLTDYLRLTNHQWVEIDRSSQNMARITAWSLVAYLMESEIGRQALRRYLQAVKRGTPSEAIAMGHQELEAAYPGGIARLERDWRSWILEVRKAQTF